MSVCSNPYSESKPSASACSANERTAAYGCGDATWLPMGSTSPICTFTSLTLGCMVWHVCGPLPCGYVLTRAGHSEESPLSNDPIRWGLLGTARINAKLLAGARLSPDTDVIAVGSRTAETR